jgi:hypothetical protein
MRLFWKLFATCWIIVGILIVGTLTLFLLKIFIVAAAAAAYSVVLIIFAPGGASLGLAGFTMVAAYFGVLGLSGLTTFALGAKLIHMWWPHEPNSGQQSFLRPPNNQS